MNNILTKSGKFSVIFACILLLIVSASAQLTLRKALDFDGDGKADFSVMRPDNNFWYIKKTNGTFTYQQFGSFVSDEPTPGDYDGDGKADISVFRDNNGTWYRINSSTNTFTGVQFGVSGDTPVARDYDGDGKTDVAVVRRTNGVMNWYVLGSMRGFFAAQFGAANDYVAPGDYDGDGKFDFAVQRPGASNDAPANFYVLKTSDNSLLAVQWGVSNDLVAPGDYDGDGKTDIAVVREGTSLNAPINWYIRRSTDGGLTAVSFGATQTDLLAQADYDGDGKTDIGVWRDTNGVFYALRSTNGSVLGVQWGSPNDYPIASFDTH